MRTLSKENVLELCVNLVRDHEIKNPLTALIMATRVVKFEGVDHVGAFHAAAKAAGGSLVKWYGDNGAHRTLAQTLELFEDALFQAQVGG